MGDVDIEMEIFGEDDPVKIKRMHKNVKWTGDEFSYIKVMAELICVGNWQKYKQQHTLRNSLFRTQGSLVESNTYKSIWSCGLPFSDIRATNPDNWPIGSINLNGELLTFIRHKLSLCKDFKSEYDAILQQCEPGNRKRSWPDLDNGIKKFK